MVSFIVAIDLYWVSMFGCLLRNAVTSRYMIVPVDETTKIWVRIVDVEHYDDHILAGML